MAKLIVYGDDRARHWSGPGGGGRVRDRGTEEQPAVLRRAARQRRVRSGDYDTAIVSRLPLTLSADHDFAVMITAF
jgi:hypothetical protein